MPCRWDPPDIRYPARPVDCSMRRARLQEDIRKRQELAADLSGFAGFRRSRRFEEAERRRQQEIQRRGHKGGLRPQPKGLFDTETLRNTEKQRGRKKRQREQRYRAQQHSESENTFCVSFFLFQSVRSAKSAATSFCVSSSIIPYATLSRPRLPELAFGIPVELP